MNYSHFTSNACKVSTHTVDTFWKGCTTIVTIVASLRKTLKSQNNNNNNNALPWCGIAMMNVQKV